jgi:hypothetical protein
MKLLTWSCYLVSMIATALHLAGCRTVSFPESSIEPLDLQPKLYLVDSSYSHFHPSLADSVATLQQGSRPLAWGRYLINQAGSDSQKNSYKELTLAEVAELQRLRIPLVPIVAPNQRVLSGTRAAGQALATRSTSILESLLARAPPRDEGTGVLIFLDVEGDSHPISDEFLIGWCQTLSAYRSKSGFTFLPAIYTNAGLSATGVRKTIIRTSSTCPVKGLWLAQYTSSAAIPEVWKDMRTDTRRRLPPIPEDIPIYLWQYYPGSGGAAVDYSLVNPDLATEFSRSMIVLQ